MKLQSIALLLASAVALSDASVVRHNVRRRLAQAETADIVVELRSSVSHRHLLESVDALDFPSRKEKIEFVVDSLQTAAASSQREIDALLAQEAASTQPLFASQYTSWSRNARYFNGATLELVEKLAALSSVVEIREAEFGSVSLPQEDVGTSVAADSLHPEGSIEWGVQRVEAPQTWVSGITGEGVVVGDLDTGARATHEALRDSKRADYYWYDPVNKTAEPYDPHGHGTHTLGTIVGSKGIGVAPGAKWMACLGCPNGGCPESSVVACGEWFICPTNTQGENRDCSKAPHVINNSWSGNAASKTYVPMIAAWHAAGIIPIFAVGNAGPYCNTARSPGNFANVIAVGSTTVNNTLSRFSCKGPNGFDTTILKPDISAPGQEVVSASNSSDTEYRVLSGTSMATPHVTGVVALLLSQPNGAKTYDEVRDVLTSTTLRGDVLQPNLLPTPIGWYTGVCGNTTDDDWPNNQYGYGLVNALTATQANAKL